MSSIWAKTLCYSIFFASRRNQALDYIHTNNQSQKHEYTHDEAVVASVLTVEEAVAGLEEEQARLRMVIIGGDTKCPKTFTLS